MTPPAPPLVAYQAIKVCFHKLGACDGGVCGLYEPGCMKGFANGLRGYIWTGTVLHL